jgi:chromosome segregation ATPase
MIETVKEYSPTLTEPAEVVDLVYTPERHGTAEGTGVDLKLNVSMVSSTVDIPRKYAVVFQCQHGKFIIEDNQEKAKALWGRLKEGQSVTVSYREVYDVTYTSTNGAKKETARKLVDYDFLDAR